MWMTSCDHDYVVWYWFSISGVFVFRSFDLGILLLSKLPFLKLVVGIPFFGSVGRIL